MLNDFTQMVNARRLCLSRRTLSHQRAGFIIQCMRHVIAQSIGHVYLNMFLCLFSSIVYRLCVYRLRVYCLSSVCLSSVHISSPHLSSPHLSSIICASTRLSSERLLVLLVANHFSNHKFSRHFHQCENTLQNFAPLIIQYSNRI